MTNIGVIEQYKGPFIEGYELNLKGNCKIGISIGENDFIKLGSENNTSFVFIINNQIIHMGKTCIYETDNQINDTIIQFPNGAPLSTIVDVVYCEAV